MFPIFDKLGGQDAALEALAGARDGKLAGRKPTKHTLKLWRANGRMPGAAVFGFEKVCRDRGIAFDIADCVLKREPAAA